MEPEVFFSILRQMNGVHGYTRTGRLVRRFPATNSSTAPRRCCSLRLLLEGDHCQRDVHNNRVVYLHVKLNCVSDTRPNHSDALVPDVMIASKIQPGERRALPQRPRKARRPSIPYVIAFKIQRGERRALTQHPRQPPSPFIPYAIDFKT